MQPAQAPGCWQSRQRWAVLSSRSYSHAVYLSGLYMARQLSRKMASTTNPSRPCGLMLWPHRCRDWENWWRLQIQLKPVLIIHKKPLGKFKVLMNCWVCFAGSTWFSIEYWNKFLNNSITCLSICMFKRHTSHSSTSISRWSVLKEGDWEQRDRFQQHWEVPRQ